MKLKPWMWVVGVVVAAGILVTGMYNNLTVSREKVDNQWAQVQAQYQRRFDLIPNLVETVKGVAKQEQEVFGAIAEARTRYAGAKSADDQVAAVNQLESSLARLLVIVEQYPTLKSSEAYITLMSQLEGTENRISVERGRYNDVVTSFNTSVKRFPTNIIAGYLGFGPKAYFEAVKDAANPPPVKF